MTMEMSKLTDTAFDYLWSIYFLFDMFNVYLTKFLVNEEGPLTIQ